MTKRREKRSSEINVKQIINNTVVEVSVKLLNF
jgi:hypothetical protein